MPSFIPREPSFKVTHASPSVKIKSEVLLPRLAEIEREYQRDKEEVNHEIRALQKELKQARTRARVDEIKMKLNALNKYLEELQTNEEAENAALRLSNEVMLQFLGDRTDMSLLEQRVNHLTDVQRRSIETNNSQRPKAFSSADGLRAHIMLVEETYPTLKKQMALGRKFKLMNGLPLTVQTLALIKEDLQIMSGQMSYEKARAALVEQSLFQIVNPPVLQQKVQAARLAL